MARPRKSEFENGKIPAKWQKVCLYEVEHPEAKQDEVCQACGISKRTLYDLHHNDKYMEFYHKENERVFRGLEAIAIAALHRQVRKKSNIKAASYILDYLQYKAPDKVDLQSNGVVEINLTGGEDGDPFTPSGDEDEE